MPKLKLEQHLILLHFSPATLIRTATALDPHALDDESLLCWCMYLESNHDAPRELAERFDIEYLSRGGLL